MGPSPTVLASPTYLKQIIRLATHDEISLLSLKREEEEELLKICRAKVHQRGLPMHIVDAEYRFDRHKLTFFFEAEFSGSTDQIFFPEQHFFCIRVCKDLDLGVDFHP
jgi:hypothetical protein